MVEQGFKMDKTYRGSQEYKDYMAMILKDAPWLPTGLAEYCIIAHKQDPQAYKKDKHSKKILAEPLTPPTNAGEIVVDNHVHVGELTDDILEQRREFFEKHGLSEEVEFIPKTTIEEVQVDV